MTGDWRSSFLAYLGFGYWAWALSFACAAAHDFGLARWHGQDGIGIWNRNHALTR